MSWAVVAVSSAAVIGGVISADAQRSAASKASKEQSRAAGKGISEQRRQFNEVQRLLSPYVSAGDSALMAQQSLIGLAGPEAQQQAIGGIVTSPQFQAMMQQSEEGILQNRAATGGVRGGDTEGAVAQFRPRMLTGLMDERFNQFGGLARMGQASAAGQAQLGQQSGAGMANLFSQQGSYRAANELAQGQANANMYGNIARGIGQAGGSF